MSTIPCFGRRALDCLLSAWLAMGLVGAMAGPSAAANPRDDLLRLVPEDMGFCLMVQHLRQHSEAFLGSPFVAHFRKSALGQAIENSPEMRQLAAVEKRLQQELGIDWARLRNDILGDAVVLAYRPGPWGQQEQEQGLILVRARDGKLLGELLERMNEIQTQSGELKEVQERRYKQAVYYCRVERKRSHYYYLRDRLLALASQEQILKQLIDQERQPAKGEPLVLRQLRQVGADQDLAALWINPRVFLPEIERRTAQAMGPEAAGLRKVVAYWKALEGVVLSAGLQKTSFELKLAVLARPHALPPAARAAFEGQATPSELWRRFPQDAMLAVAARFNAVALSEGIADLLNADDRQAMQLTLNNARAVLDKDVRSDILPNLGPDWGLYVAAPSPGAKAWVPYATLALRVQPGKKGAPLDQVLAQALKSLAMVAVLSYNSSHADQMSLKSDVQDQVEVTYVVNEKLFLPGFQPALAIKGGYLLLSTSREGIGRFAAEPTADRPSEPKGEIPLLRLALRELRMYIKERHEELAMRLTERNHMSREEAERRLNQLVAGAELFDRLELMESAAPGRVTLILRLQTAQPLRK